MLQNAYLLAKIGADTAENEQHFAENVPTTLRASPMRLLLEALLAVAAARAPVGADRPGLSPLGGVPM